MRVAKISLSVVVPLANCGPVQQIYLLYRILLSRHQLCLHQAMLFSVPRRRKGVDLFWFAKQI